VRALTGSDPDRLPQEKERGITIDLGFAHAELGPSLVASFVDVPGHERFVRNMLAGAHGIDAVVLVVAADESVMPQTREHFQICRLLGIPRGLVALTKSDLADETAQAVAEQETAELVRGSFLEGRPLVRVSARTGEGLDALRAALLELALEAAPRPADGLLRLPVDRVFTMKGFGTVATGTLVAGAVEVGEELEILPAGRRVRVRGLQVHGESAPRAIAGTRTAVNLAGVEKEELGRGDVLVRPGSLAASSMLDVELRLLPEAKPLKDGARVRVHVASAEALARVRLLEAGPLAPGGAALAQIRLESRVAAGRGDKLVIRSYSPAATIGGAAVIDPLPPRRRLKDRAAVERLRAASGPAEAALALVSEAGAAGIEEARLAARLTLPVPELRAAVAASPGLVALGQDEAVIVAASALDELGASAMRALEAYHAAEPLRAAMPREALRDRAFASAPAAAFERVLQELAAAGRVRLAPDAVALSGHAVRLSPDEQDARRLLTEAARAAGLAGVEALTLAESARSERALVERVARVLVNEKVLARVGERGLVDREALEQLKRQLRERFAPGAKLEVGVLKELTGLTRKHVIPLLEYLDRERVTRRAGADRVLL
jgi:selenocysteine-specific elongation factor